MKRLQALWYQKLKDKGFKDIEWPNGQLKFGLSSPGGARGFQSSAVGKRISAEYYRQAGQALHNHTFPNKTYKRIWALHSEGLTAREVGRKVDLTRKQVIYRIRKMRKMFAI